MNTKFFSLLLLISLSTIANNFALSIKNTSDKEIVIFLVYATTEDETTINEYTVLTLEDDKYVATEDATIRKDDADIAISNIYGEPQTTIEYTKNHNNKLVKLAKILIYPAIDPEIKNNERQIKISKTTNAEGKETITTITLKTEKEKRGQTIELEKLPQAAVSTENPQDQDNFEIIKIGESFGFSTREVIKQAFYRPKKLAKRSFFSWLWG
jgi:hypothetical protein